MSKTVDLLGQQAEYYLNHTCKTIDKKLIHVPGPDVIVKSGWTPTEMYVPLIACKLCTDMDALRIPGMYPFCRRPGYRTYSRSIIRS